MLTSRWSNFYIVEWFGVIWLLILLFMFQSKMSADCTNLIGSRLLALFSLNIFCNMFALNIILFYGLVFWQFPGAKPEFLASGNSCLFHLTTEFWRAQIQVLVRSEDRIIFNLLFKPSRLLLYIHVGALGPRFPHFFYFIHWKNIKIYITRSRVDDTVLSLVSLGTALLGNCKNITIIVQEACCLWFETLSSLSTTGKSTRVLDNDYLLLFPLFKLLSFDL